MLISFLLLGCLNFFLRGAGSPAPPGVATAAASTPGNQPAPTQIVSNTALDLAFAAGGVLSCLSQSCGAAHSSRNFFDEPGQTSGVQHPFGHAQISGAQRVISSPWLRGGRLCDNVLQQTAD
jgi:hypothetical protein